MTNEFFGVGLDVGTMNLVSARRTEQAVETKRLRNAFLDIPMAHKKMLAMTGVSHFVRDEDLIIVGDVAYDMANMFRREVRRPLQSGLVSTGDMDALEILAKLIQQVLGPPKKPKEKCYFSVPAPPVDDLSKDIVYHSGMLSRIISDCGYDPVAGNEAMAIIYSECPGDQFSGLAVSYGSGMSNLALAVHTIEGMTFSVGRGGDSIDAGAAKAVGSTSARICSIKEQGLDLQNPKGREQEAIALYYRDLIEYTLRHIVEQFSKNKGSIVLPQPIPFVVSGGTSKATGFLEIFREIFEAKRKNFPIPISEVRAAQNPLDAVARGLLVQASQE